MKKFGGINTISFNLYIKKNNIIIILVIIEKKTNNFVK